MESIKLKTYIGKDGVLSLRLPISNQDVEAMIIYQPVLKVSHRESWRRFRDLLDSYGEEVFEGTTEILRGDRQRG